MDYLKLIDEYRAEMVESISELVSIKSVVEEPCDDKEQGHLPFGRGVQEALNYMLKKAEKDGFEIENVDNYGAHIEYGGYTLNEEGEIITVSDEIMGIIGHLDVVPEGSGWSYEPYGGVVADGKIYGRGTADDKGPVMAAYYALKALKDSGFVPAKKVRIILGLDEETNWDGMKYYLSKVKAPDFGFTPDAEFPAIHGEKGILVFRIAKKLGKPSDSKGLALKSIKGGAAANMVPDSARALVSCDNRDYYEKIKEQAAKYREEKGYKVNTKGVGKSLEITTTGKSAHGSTPELGVNAISILIDFLSQFTFVQDDMNDFIKFYNNHIGFETDGTSMGCGFSDEPSGKLVFNLGMCDITQEAAELTINIRYPVTMTGDHVYEAMMPLINEYDFGIIKGKEQLPIYIPAEDPFIECLMDIYKQHTGDEECKPLVIGGGTYARATPGIVAFGPIFPGEPELAHQKDEYVDIDNLIKATKIFADAIYRLTVE